MMEVHLTDASVSTLLGSKKDSMATVYLDQVKSINKVTDKDIEAIFAYLKDHPAYAEEIYGGMIKEINERQRSEKKDKKEKRDKKEVPK